ncbi:MAG: hypothetical protein U1E62_12000 [Alsobacter sp.]
MPVSADVVQISARAAEVCGAEGAQKVAFQQAAVETIRRGYDRFVILGAQESATTEVVGVTPVIANTYGNATANTFGSTTYASGSATTTFTGGQPISVTRHREGLTVKMFREGDPAGVNALSARVELGPEWQEKVKASQLTCF